MSPSIARKIIKSFNPSTDNPLSKRENEILENFVKVKTTNQLQIHYSLAGIQFVHTSKIFTKTSG